MKFKYDKEVDAAYISLGDSPNTVESESFEIEGFVPFGDINIDFDESNKIVGIEILNATKYLPETMLEN